MSADWKAGYLGSTALDKPLSLRAPLFSCRRRNGRGAGFLKFENFMTEINDVRIKLILVLSSPPLPPPPHKFILYLCY